MGRKFHHICLGHLLRAAAFFVMLGLSFGAAAKNDALRYEIDTKRQGISATDREALPRGREFVRLDSTYYVGWMYQGLFYHDRAADQNGYLFALPYVSRAFLLLEEDFKEDLKTIYDDPWTYFKKNTLYNDYLTLGSALKEVYEYMDRPDSAFWVLDQVEKKHFNRDFLGVAGSKAWLIHRNRSLTNETFSFLSRDVMENEKKALQECYKGLQQIEDNALLNNSWFGTDHVEQDKDFIFHYLALIHAYLKNYDSSFYYYNILQEHGNVSFNNLGGLYAENGQFGEARKYLEMDMNKYEGLKILKEPYYYIPLYDVYAGRPLNGIRLSASAVQMSNSSPGFGWYNIALARSYLYDGQLDSAAIILAKAHNFREVHIGTTLTQQQYDFTTDLLQHIWYKKKKASIRFLHKNWWYSIKWLSEMARYKWQNFLLEYELMKAFRKNPERARIIYDLFCTESTISFDEVYALMDLLGKDFARKTMNDRLMNDQRLRIHPYFKMGAALATSSNSDRQKALQEISQQIDTKQVDTAFQQLFPARVYEQLWKQADREKNEGRQLFFQQKLFQSYAQLMPFSNVPIRIYLEVKGDHTPLTREVMNQIQNSNLIVGDVHQRAYLHAVLQFRENGLKTEVNISNLDHTSGKKIENRLIFQQADGVAEEIVLRMFGKQGSLEMELSKPSI